jgi:triosephosphate isomerase
MTRQKYVLGNWKMYGSTTLVRQLAAEVVKGVGGESRVNVAVCPPFPYLGAVGEVIRGTPVRLGAQDAYFEKEGAFTGSVSPDMLADVGCTYVILGHSERRHGLHESDWVIHRKVFAALRAGLHVVFCLGETPDERKAGLTDTVIRFQLTAGLGGLEAQALAKVIVAYEPVWAIGTGQTATPEQAQQAHEVLRRQAARIFGEETAARLPILYGGSVKPENVVSLLRMPDVDGGLVGGASLHADAFLAIVRATG